MDTLCCWLFLDNSIISQSFPFFKDFFSYFLLIFDKQKQYLQILGFLVLCCV
jgi:hypothetical protein